jgi:hypothetical protein
VGRTSRSAAGLLAGLPAFATRLIRRYKCGSSLLTQRTRAAQEVRATPESRSSVWAETDFSTASKDVLIFALLRGQDVAGARLCDQLVGVLTQQQTLAHSFVRGSLDSRDISVVILVALLQ